MHKKTGKGKIDDQLVGRSSQSFMSAKEGKRNFKNVLKLAGNDILFT